MATAIEIRTFFQQSYKTELLARLKEKAQDGELDSVIDGDCIDGGLLSGVDETANSETKSEFGWREDSAEIAEALEQPECYEGIDYAAIIAEARK